MELSNDFLEQCPPLNVSGHSGPVESVVGGGGGGHPSRLDFAAAAYPLLPLPVSLSPSLSVNSTPLSPCFGLREGERDGFCLA